MITEKYNISSEELLKTMDEMDWSEELAVLDAVAENRKCFKQGAVHDLDRASSLLLDDFRNGRLGRISLERRK